MPVCLNPNYTLPPEPPAITNIKNWFAANPGVRGVSFAQIRAQVPAAAALSDGAIEQYLRDYGLTVVV